MLKNITLAVAFSACLMFGALPAYSQGGEKDWLIEQKHGYAKPARENKPLGYVLVLVGAYFAYKLYSKWRDDDR